MTAAWAPWSPATGDTRRAFEDELRAEVVDGHPLHGTAVTAEATCDGCDDVLFIVAAARLRWAVAHLTWSGGPERPPWPRTTLFDTEADARRHVAGHEH